MHTNTYTDSLQDYSSATTYKTGYNDVLMFSTTFVEKKFAHKCERMKMKII